MKIVFSEHANERNKLRIIPKIYVLQTIKKPEKVINSFRGRKLLQKTFGDKILEVVTFTEKDVITVVTQYYLEKK